MNYDAVEPRTCGTLSEYRLVVLGVTSAGKSSLTIQFVNNHFVTLYDPTIEDSYRTHSCVDGKLAVLDILDTASCGTQSSSVNWHHTGATITEDFSAIRDQYMKTAQAFLLVYSITDRDSFQSLSPLHHQILRVRGSRPVVMCGNKCDLDAQRQVTTKEGQDFAKSSGCIFWETSALTRHNVDNAFHSAVRQARQLEAGNTPKKTKEKRKKKCTVL
ncbi:Ras GTPase [Pelomyxa schiedti]|nr:Ras GTPase [Pelomyxa schiedti]